MNQNSDSLRFVEDPKMEEICKKFLEGVRFKKTKPAKHSEDE